MKESGKRCIAVNDAMALIGDKWTVLVLGALAKRESLRYTELQRAVVGISQRMVTLTVKTLEENGLVRRTVFATVPPRVDYELTSMGRTLVEPLKALLVWSVEHGAEIADARRAYAASSKTR